MSKNKVKTKAGAKKRFRIGGTGRVKFKRAGLKHILSKRPSKNKRKLRRQGTVDKTSMDHIRKMLPNSL